MNKKKKMLNVSFEEKLNKSLINWRRILYFITLLSAFALGFIYFWQSDHSTYVISLVSWNSFCTSHGGDWVLLVDECEKPSTKSEQFGMDCEGHGGRYIECDSACRNKINGDSRLLCTDDCIQVCRFDESND